MSVPRFKKLARRRMIAAEIPEVDWPYLTGGMVIGSINVLLWVAVLHALGVV